MFIGLLMCYVEVFFVDNCVAVEPFLADVSVFCFSRSSDPLNSDPSDTRLSNVTLKRLHGLILSQIDTRTG